MTSIADIGARHLRDALTGTMAHIDVNAWRDDSGRPVRIYYRPLTGTQQALIDEATPGVARTCQTLKVRALDASGKPVFADTALASLQNDYDYTVIRAIVYYMFAGQGDDDAEQEAIEKE